MVALSGFHERLLPLRLIHTVGIELRLQSNTAPLGIADTALTGLPFQEITAVELKATAVGRNGHDSAGIRIFQRCARIAENFKIVIVTTLQLQ